MIRRGCRIGKVTFKDSKLAVYQSHRYLTESDIAELHKSFDRDIDSFDGKMVGAVIVTWNRDLKYNLSTLFDVENPLHYQLLPGFVADVIRQQGVEYTIKQALIQTGVINPE